MSICMGLKHGDSSQADALGVLSVAAPAVGKLKSSFPPMLALEILGMFACLAGTFSFSFALLALVLVAKEGSLLLKL